MYRVIDIGEEKVALLARSSTNVFYKSVFHEDPIDLTSGGEIPLSKQIAFSQQLTFIMSKQAEAQEAVNAGKSPTIRDFMQTVTEDDYVDWLERFDFMDLQDSLEEAMNVYTESSKTTSKAKK